MDKALELKKMLAALDPERLTKEDFVKAVEAFVDRFNEQRDQVMAAVEEIRAALRAESVANREADKDEIGSLRNETMAIRKAVLNDLEKRADDLLRRIDARLTTVQDGKDADPEKVVQEVVKRIVVPTAEDVINGLPAFPERVRDGLELLPDGEKLVIDAIQGLRKELDEIRKLRGKEVLLGGGPHYLAGSGISIEGNVLSATGSGTFGIITVSGTIDDSNTSFTAASTPTIVVINGTNYRNGKGVTIAGTAITTDNPVGTGGDIYAL